MQALYAIMQCYGKLYNVHDIFSLFCDFDFDLIFFFFGKHKLTVLLKEVIVHATLSYLFENLSGNSLRVYVLFDLVT